MDFLDPKKRRAHKIRLYIGYALMSLLVLGLATLLVFQAYGYNFNPKTGDITQNGLLFVDAHPQAANVVLNGRSRGNTGQRLVLPAGGYTLELQRDGYRSWHRDFTLQGGTIERFVYPFLFPEQFETAQVQLYAAAPAFATQSPDRRWLLVQQPNSFTGFDIVDLNNEVPIAVNLSLPAGIMTATGNTHTLTLVEWSTDNRHVVIKHAFDGGQEYILIDRENPSQSVNLSRTFTQPFTSLSLRDKRFDRYYLYNDGAKTLASAELQSRVVEPLLQNVLQYRSHGDDVLLYVTPSSSSADKVVATVLEDGESYPLREFPAGDKYLLDVARFENRWYMAAGAVSEEKVYILRDPVAALKASAKRLIPAAILRIEKAEYISFSHNARFIGVQGGSHFAVYDAENDDIYRYDTELKLIPGQKAVWMDGHRLCLVSGGKVEVFDYDGTNKHALVASHDGFIPFFDRDYTALYTIAPAPNLTDRSALLRSKLIVESD